MRLTLLRGPTNPDPTADLGEHRFVYSLLPHSGSWNEHTLSEAYALNDPLLVAATREPHAQTELAKPSRRQSFVAVDAPNVVIETVKQAEDGAGIIVRLYESQRKRGAFTVRTAFQLALAWRTNLLEENQEALEVDGDLLRTYIKPYQIITLRLLPAAEQQSLS